MLGSVFEQGLKDMAHDQDSQSHVGRKRLPLGEVSKYPRKTRGKSVPQSAFDLYMKRHYGEHFRRITAWRRAAKWALFVYPVASALALAMPCVGFYAGVKQLYRLQPEWFSQFLSPETQSFVLPALLALSGMALFFGLMMGIGFGISRARMLTFEAERTELNVRHSYFLRRIARTKMTTSRPREIHQHL